MSAIDNKPMPRLKAVAAGNDFELVVTWAAGDRKGRMETVDISPLILTHKFYKPLRNNADLFESVQLIDRGTAVEWGDGEIDMPATSIERLAEEMMTNEDFRDWMEANKLSYTSTSAVLGLSRRTIANYAKDARIPRHIFLACQGYEARNRES